MSKKNALYLFLIWIGFYMLTTIVSCNKNKETKHFSAKIYPNVQYAENDNKRQNFDLYVPDTGKKAYPLILWVHGGAWKKGDKGAISGEDYFLKKSFAMARINYRYSTTDKYPAQLKDLESAVKYLKKYADEFNIDKNSIFAVGHSAGGSLVSALATTKDEEASVNAVVNICGGVDFRILGLKREGDTRKENSISTLLGQFTSDNPAYAYEMSPISQISKNTAPHLLLFGENDVVVPYTQGVIMHEALQKNGIDSEIHLMKEGTHVDARIWQEENFNRIIDFLKKYIR